MSDIQKPIEIDEEENISPSPLLSAVQKSLQSADRHNENRLFIVLTAFVILALLYEQSGVKNLWFDFVMMISFLSAIGFTIHLFVRDKKRALYFHGLVCSDCGYEPQPHMVNYAATTLRCTKCGALLKGL
jgi:hypothetical protein